MPSTIAPKVLYEYQPLLAVRYDCRSLETRAATESSNVMIFEHRLGPLFAEFEFCFASRSLRPLSRSFSSSHFSEPRRTICLAPSKRDQTTRERLCGRHWLARRTDICPPTDKRPPDICPLGPTASACPHVRVACRVNYFGVGVTSSEG